MSEVKRFDHVNHAHVDDCEHIDNPEGAWVKASDYDALAAEAQALREEVARAEQHRNDQADLIVSLRTEVAALRMARDDLKLERDLARQNFCDEQAANYQLQAHLKACLGELSELRARVVVLPSVDNVMNIVMRYQWNEKTNVTGTTNWAANLGMKVVEEVKRLKGKAVSEGLLRNAKEAISEYAEGIKSVRRKIPGADQRLAELGQYIEELGTLLGEGKEHE
ncbi:TPA: hypothetical protein ACM2X8_003855 [Pseudomonas aeruginosa]|uniref:hypothetical protein n=1 Tax=Pseudomonas aeruginosa TaxID=287 RepID=UPI0018C682F6|nr:hypothetical protein [Pseudomonas aeruginosa]ELO0933395.1 hypothetical protein [Pseudomonas aeruginosa]MBG6396798.1 hypothetical protein [Pseudomonas aeruginosa]HBO4653712.1 hypothetical protein [Pseudomonas aeruginosa]HBO5252912.1 hypothetical protein [Pseudomonas aeruginosa]HDL5046168.1 hypothetical protein [Pseudomonas aeruginosa]